MEWKAFGNSLNFHVHYLVNGVEGVVCFTPPGFCEVLIGPLLDVLHDLQDYGVENIAIVLLLKDCSSPLADLRESVGV